MTRIDRLARLIVVAAIIGLSIAWLLWTFNGFSLSDAHAYRTAAERLLAGADLYQPAATQGEAFRYAPWFAAAWVPIAALPRAVGDALWAIALVAASVVAVLPLMKRPDLASRLLAILGGTMLLWTAARGNVHPLLMVAFEPDLQEFDKLADCRRLKKLDLTHTGESLTRFPIHLVELTPRQKERAPGSNGESPRPSRMATTIHRAPSAQ